MKRLILSLVFLLAACRQEKTSAHNSEKAKSQPAGAILVQCPGGQQAVIDIAPDGSLLPGCRK